MNYFKDENLALLFKALHEKYIKTSKLTGTIKINPNYEEASKIGRFLGLNLKAKKENIIKISSIEKAIAKSKFEGTTILEILNYLYGNIITKQDLKEKLVDQKRKLINDLSCYYKASKIYPWLIESLNDKKFYTKVINLLIHENKSIYYILDALIDRLYNTDMLNLSIFASRITKDPHYFDLDSHHSRDLIWLICYYNHLDFNNTRSYKIEVLNSIGIYTDYISNYVITYNLHGTKYLDNLAKRSEVAILSLNNINNLDKVYAKNNKIFILENPSLLDVIMAKNYNSAFIITSGNPNIACHKLLDKLSHHQLYYNGDFDPEGLLIADKLKQKYPSLALLGYSKDLFYQAKSNKEISPSRIKKLDNVTTYELREVKSMIIETNKVGYQEKIVNNLIDEINQINTRK